MSANELIEQIKALPQPERWDVYRLLKMEFEQDAHERLFEDFTLIGSDCEQSDVAFAESAQLEALKNG